jgi:hypothetical protein
MKDPKGASSIPGYVDFVHSVPDVQTDVTVFAFSLTFNRIVGVGEIVLVVAFSPLIELSVATDIAVAEVINPRVCISRIVLEILDRYELYRIAGGANACVL